MITGECHYCHSQRNWKLSPVQHEDGCPTGGRRPQRLGPSERTLFDHPDVVELDLHVTAWYPQLTG